MKKFLPILILILGLLVVGVVFFLVKGNSTKKTTEDEKLMEIPLGERPLVSLTPTSDGHYLNLKVEKIKIQNAASLDYELVYEVPGGVSQGVPGTISVKGKDAIEEELLLGSESSGKYRYDEGVEKGTITIGFRNESGKLIAKFSADFGLFSDNDLLSTPDGIFQIKLAEVPEKQYFVLMETFGIPESTPSPLVSGPYGLFSSTKIEKLAGDVNIQGKKVYMHVTGSRWEEIISEKTFDSDTGVFYGSD